MNNPDTITLYDKEGNLIKIPTISYINRQATLIANKVFEHIMTLYTRKDPLNPNLGIDIENNLNITIPYEDDLSREIKIEDILTDKEHQFVTKQQLKKLDNALTNIDLEAAINDCAINFRNQLNEDINKILNTHDVIDKLRTIAEILQQENTLDDIINLISSKASQADLDKHILDERHITNEDRESLNILNKTVEDGIDWDDDSEEKIRLLNKPKSLPADGGNAHTIDNYNVTDLINHQSTGIIVGCEADNEFLVPYLRYNINQVTHNTKNCFDKDIISQAKVSGNTLSIRVGNYYITENTVVDHVHIEGENNYTIIDICEDNIIILSDTEINNVTFSDGTIVLKDNVKITNCQFNYVDIIFENSNFCTVEHNLFKECTSKLRGIFQYNMICKNRSIAQTEDPNIFTFFGIDKNKNTIADNQVI